MSYLLPKQVNVVANLSKSLDTAPWILRIAKNKEGAAVLTVLEQADGELEALGFALGSDLRGSMDVIRLILSKELDSLGRPAGIESLISDTFPYEGEIPLSEEAGGKLALLFILRPREHDPLRTELLAWRIERFTREEALYWLGRVTVPIYTRNAKSRTWAKKGLRIMLCGNGTQDAESVREMLDVLRK